jgi:glycosyltransferase involved in cell wall biosynthesis
MQFADLINRHDFIDVILQRADRARFRLFATLRTRESNIAEVVYPPDVPSHLLAGTSRRWIPLTAVRLAALLRHHRIDVLHTHHYDQAFIGRLATRLHPRTRLVVGRHYAEISHYAGPGLKREALWAVERFVYSGAAQVVVPSRMIRESVLARGLPAAKVEIVPYGFFPEKYDPFLGGEPAALHRELGLDGRVLFGTFAKLSPNKGVHVLLEAAAAVRQAAPNAAFVVCGEGSERPRLEAMIAAAGMGEHVRLLGWRKDAMRIMSGVDVVVQPTFHEAFSQVMGEACFLGKPLVFTRVSGAEDVITDGENGILVPPREAAPLGAAIARLAGDAALRVRMGAAGRRVALERLTVERVIPRYEAVYARALGRE